MHFDYQTPETMESAVREFLAGEDRVLIAGGTDLVPLLKSRARKPARVLSLSRKVEVICDPELNRQYPDYIISVLEVETKDGKKYSKENKIVIGDWVKPLSDQQIDDKFRKFTEGLLTREQANDVLVRIKNLANIKSAKGFVTILHEYASKQHGS